MIVTPDLIALHSSTEAEQRQPNSASQFAVRVVTEGGGPIDKGSQHVSACSSFALPLVPWNNDRHPGCHCLSGHKGNGQQQSQAHHPRIRPPQIFWPPLTALNPCIKAIAELAAIIYGSTCSLCCRPCFMRVACSDEARSPCRSLQQKVDPFSFDKVSIARKVQLIIKAKFCSISHEQ